MHDFESKRATRSNKLFPWCTVLLERHAESAGNRRAPRHHLDQPEALSGWSQSLKVSDLPTSEAPDDIEPPHPAATDATNASEYSRTLRPTIRGPSHESPKPLLSRDDAWSSAVNENDTHASVGESPLSDQFSAILPAPTGQPVKDDAEQTPATGQEEHGSSGQQSQHSARERRARGLQNSKGNAYRTGRHRHRPASTKWPTKERNGSRLPSSRISLDDTTDGSARVLQDVAGVEELLQDSATQQLDEADTRRDAPQEVQCATPNVMRLCRSKGTFEKRHPAHRSTWTANAEGEACAGFSARDRVTTGRDMNWNELLKDANTSERHYIRLGERVKQNRRGRTCGHQAPEDNSGGAPVSLPSRASRRFRNRGSTTSDLQGEWSARRLLDVRRLDDLWSLLQTQNLHRLSGTELTNIVLRLLSLSSVAANAELGNETGALVGAEPNDLYNHSQAFEGQDDKNATDWRNSQRKVLDMAKMIRMREDVKRHPIFKDILSLLPQRVDSLDASSGVALLHALARFGLRPSATLLGRLGDVIVDRALAGVLYPMKFKTNENARAPEHLTEHHAELTNAELSQLWVSCETLVPLQRARLFQALMQLTMDKFRTATARLESALSREEESWHKPLEESSSHGGQRQPSDQFPELNHINEGGTLGCQEGSNKEVPGSTEQTRRTQAGQGGIWRDLQDLGVDVGTIAAVARAAAGMNLGEFHKPFVQVLERLVTALLRLGCQSIGRSAAPQEISESGESDPHFSGCPAHEHSRETSSSRRESLDPPAFDTQGGCGTSAVHSQFASVLARLVYSVTKLKQEREGQPALGGSEACAGGKDNNRKTTNPGMAPYYDWAAGNDEVTYATAARQDGAATVSLAKERNLLPPLRPVLHSGGDDHKVERRLDTDVDDLLESFTAFFATAADCVRPVHSVLPHLLAAASFLFRGYVKMLGRELPPETVMLTTDNETGCRGMGRKLQQALPPRGMKSREAGTFRLDFGKTRTGMAEGKSRLDQLAENMSCLLSLASRAVDREWDRLDSLPNVVTMLLSLHSLEQSRIRLVAMNRDSRKVEPGVRKGGAASDGSQSGASPEGKEDAASSAGYLKRTQRRSHGASVVRRLAARLQLLLSKLENHREVNRNIPDITSETGKEWERMGMYGVSGGSNTSDKHPSENSSLQVKHLPLLENSCTLLRLLIRLNMRSTATLLVKRISSIIGLESEDWDSLESSTERGRSTRCTGSGGRQREESVGAAPRHGQSEHIFEGSWLTRFDARVTRKVRELSLSREFRRRIQWADSVEEVLEAVGAAAAECDSITGTDAHMESGSAVNNETSPTRLPASHLRERDALCLDSLSLSSALHRLAVLQELHVTDRVRINGPTLTAPRPSSETKTRRIADDQNVNGLKKRASDWWLHDSRMQRLLWTVVVKLPTMDHQITRILWALEKLGFFRSLSGASPLQGLSLLKVSAATAASNDSSGDSLARRRASSVDNISDRGYSSSSSPDDSAKEDAATDGYAPTASSIWQQLPSSLFSRLSELAVNHELNGTQLSSALRVIASIKAKGFFASCSQAGTVRVGTSTSSDFQDTAASQAERIGAKLLFVPSSLRTVDASFQKRIEESEACLKVSFRSLLLHLAPSMSALDASTSLFSLATLGWHSERSGLSFPVKADAEPGELRRGFKASADADPVVAAILRRLRMQISNCNAQALTNAIWAVATIASKRQKGFDPWQLKHTLPNELRRDSVFHASDDTPARFEEEDRLDGIDSSSESEEFALYVEPVALDTEERLFLETVRRDIICQVHLLGREALSMLLLAAVMLRWQEPDLLLRAVRRALALLRRSQRPRYMRQSVNRDGCHEQNAEAPQRGQPSAAAFSGSFCSTPQSVSSDDFLASDGLRLRGEEDRGEGELHSRVWAILAMLQQQSLDKYRSPSEFPGACVTERGDTVECATELKRGWHSLKQRENSKIVSDGGRGCGVSQTLTGEGMPGAEQRAYDFLDAAMEAAEVLKAALARVLSHTGWTPPKHQWRSKHVQSILLSLMTLKRDRERYAQERGSVVNLEGRWWVPEEQQQCVRGELPFFEQTEASANVATDLGVSTERAQGVIEEQQQRQHRFASGCEELVLMLETFVARSIRAVTSELTGMRTEGKNEGLSTSEVPIAREAGETETLGGMQKIVNLWVKRASLLLFALRHLRRTTSGTDSLAAWCIRNGQHTCESRTKANLTSPILEGSRSGPYPGTEVSASAEQDEKDDKQTRSHQRKLRRSNADSPAFFSDQSQCTGTSSDALVAMVELIAVMLRSGFASSSHQQFPSLLFELHSFLVACHHQSLPYQRKLAKGSATSDVMLDSLATAGNKSTEERSNSGHRGQAADQKASVSTATPAPVRQEWFEGSHVSQHIADALKRGDNLEPFGSARIHAVLEHQLRPALISWLVENMHSISDPMYNRLFPLLHLLGAMEEFLNTLNGVALQSGTEERADVDGTLSLDNASDSRLNSTVPDKMHVDESTARMPIHEASDVMAAVRRSRAALLSLLLHRRERLTFQPPSLLMSLLKAAFPRRLLAHLLPADLAHGLTALQRLKTSAEARDDAAVASFMATAYAGRTDAEALRDSRVLERISSSPVATSASYGEGVVDRTRPGAGKNLGSALEDRLLQQSNEHTHTSDWARSIVEDVPVELIAMLNRPTEEYYMLPTKGNTGKTVDPCEMPAQMDTEHNRDGVIILPRKPSTPTNAIGSSTHLRGRRLHQFNVDTDCDNCGMPMELPGSSGVSASAVGYRCGAAYRKATRQGIANTTRTQWDLLGPQQLAHAGTAAAQLLGVPSAAPVWLRMLERGQPEIAVGDAQAAGGTDAGKSYCNNCGSPSGGATAHPELHSAHRRNETTHNLLPDSSVSSFLAPAAAALTGYLLSLESPTGHTNVTSKPTPGGLRAWAVPEAVTTSALLSKQDTCQSSLLRTSPALGLPQEPLSRDGCTRAAEEQNTFQQSQIDPSTSWTWRRVRALVREKGDRLSAAGALRLLGGGPQGPAVARGLANDATTLANVLHLIQGSQHRIEKVGSNVNGSRQRQVAKVESEVDAKLRERRMQLEATGEQPAVLAPIRLKGNGAAVANESLRLLVSEERPEGTGHSGKQLPIYDEDAAAFRHGSCAATSTGTGDVHMAANESAEAKEEMQYAERLLPLQQLSVSYILELIEQLALLEEQQITSQHHKSLKRVHTSGEWKMTQSLLSSGAADNADEDRDIAVRQSYTEDDAVNIRRSVTRLLMTLAIAPTLPLDSAASLVGPVVSMYQKLQRGNEAADAGWQRPDDTKKECGRIASVGAFQMKCQPARVDHLSQDRNESHQEDKVCCKNPSPPAKRARQCRNLPENAYLNKTCDAHAMYADTGGHLDSPTVSDQLNRDLFLAASCFLHRMLPLAQEWFPRLHGHRGAALLRLLWECNSSEALPRHECSSELTNPKTIEALGSRTDGGAIRSHASCRVGGSCRTADGPVERYHRANERDSRTTTDLMGRGTSQEAAPSEQKQHSEEDAWLREAAQPYLTRNVPATVEDCLFRDRALVHNLQAAVLRSMSNLSPGALARLWEALSIQAGAASSADRNPSLLGSQGLRHGRFLTSPAVGNIVAEKLMALGCTAAYGGWPRCATDGANGPTANGGLLAESDDGHAVPIGYGNDDRSQQPTSKTIHKAGHEQSSVETASALPEDRDAASEGHWIAGAVAAAGSGLLGSEEQQRIATAKARETHGSAAYFALLSFFANSKNVSLADIAHVVRKLLFNAQRLIRRDGSLDVRSRLEAEPYKTRLCEPEACRKTPAERGNAFAKPGHEAAQQRNNEGSRLKCKDAEQPKEESSHAGVKDSRVQSGMQETNSRRRKGCCQESLELEDNFSSRADVDGETVICEESRKRKEGSREIDLMAAGWFLWIAANILHNSGTTGEKYEPQGLLRAQMTPEDNQITHDLNAALQSLLDAVLADLAAYRIQASIEQERPSSGNSSSKAIGTRSKPGELYIQLILCLDIVARIRHPLVHPGSPDGFRAGVLTRHSALPDLLDGIAHLINDCASDIEADVAARTTTDGVRQSSMEQACPPPHFLNEVERRRRYCSLDSLAYVFHLSRQARVFYPPLVEAVSRAVRAHRRLRCVSCNTAPSHQPNDALRSGAAVEDVPSSAFVSPQQVPESIFTASFKQTNGLSPGESSTSLPQSPNRTLRKDDSCHSQKERHWPALLLLADAAIHQPQEALVMLRRELLLFLDDKHTMEALPLQHLIRVLRFALTARDPVQYTANEKTFPAVSGRHAFGYDKAPSSSGRVGLSKELALENQPANSVQDGMPHGTLTVDGEEKTDVGLKRQDRIDSFEENDLSVFENRLDDQHSPKSDFSAARSTDSKSPESLIPANFTRSHDFGEPTSTRLACHPDDARAEAVYATVAARCVREGALLLKRLQEKREQGRGAFLHLLMELERKGYAPIGLIDTLNKVRLLHLMSATRFQRPASFPGSFRASGPEMSFTTMPPKENGILQRHNQDISLLTTPPAAAHQWKEIPFAKFGEYGRAGSQEGSLHQNSSLSRSVRNKAEVFRLLLDEGREWPELLRAAARHYISKGSSGFHMAISATLADDLGIAHENEAWTNEGMSLDITLATEAADGRHVAVEVDGPTHFVEFLRGPALPRDSAGSAAALDESLRNSCRWFQKIDHHHNAHKTPFSTAVLEYDPGGEARFTETERKRMKQKAFGPRVEATRCGGTTQYLPTALTQIKHQILRLFGWHVLSVPFFEWQAAQAPEASGCRPQRQILLLRRKLAAYLPRFAESLQIIPTSSHARLRRHMQRQNQRRSNDTDEQGSDGGINSVNLGTGSKQSLCGYLSLSSKDSNNQPVFPEETVAREGHDTVSGQPAGLFLAPGSKQLQQAITSARDPNKTHDCKNGDTYRTTGAGHHEHAAVGSGGGSKLSSDKQGEDTCCESQHAEHTSTDAVPQEWHGKEGRPPPPQKRHVANESNASQKPTNEGRRSGTSVQCKQNQEPRGRSKGRKRNPSAKSITGVARALQPDNLGGIESVVGDGTMANFGGGCAGGRDDASPQGADCGGCRGRHRKLSGTRMTQVYQGQAEKIRRNSTALLPEPFINAESTECKDLPTFAKP
ncbi:RAP domain-containing protein [Toxoplasma gondii RUB]|uniref:RAP domain-containing protein n=1 Tax=Toxoplasma gondii RUB TaxID=935652 RepID=A0A086LN84_TOXGO|nr:RAP domain-containing protein [Toxoplasma gondii RUB]